MAILFDLDGTLLDTSRDFHVAMNQILHQENKPSIDYETLREAISFGSRKMVAAALNVDKLSDAEYTEQERLLLPKFLRIYEANQFKHTVAFPGIEELLLQLEAENITWGIVTNKHKNLTDPLLKHLGYWDRSACVVCGDTTPNPKPAPDPLFHACKILNVDPSECIYIGDAITDVQAGKAAGMRTIAAAFGFVPQNATVADWQADAIAHTAHDIYPWIQKWLKNPA